MALFFVIFFIKGASGFVNKQVLYLTAPLFSLKNSLTGFFKEEVAFFKEKKSLEKEILLLKEKLMEQESDILLSDTLKRENEELKSIFSNTEKRALIESTIISRHDFGDYNSLIIDAGSSDGVREGMPVTAYGNILMGYTAEVSENSSRVRLISFPGNEIAVYIEGVVSAVGVGAGGENIHVNLPQDINVEIGNRVSSVGRETLFVGFVEKIFKEPVDPFQKIFLRMPVNINELTRVYLVKE